LARIGQDEAQAELDPFREHWDGIGDDWSDAPVATAVAYERLLEVAEALYRIPEDFHVNPKLARQLDKRLESVRQRGSVDWGLGEALAFGTLLREGTGVRLSGQDSTRGTFSHRHAVWHDFETGRPYDPFNHLAPDQAHFCGYNSSLTEAAVLGFDYGYSLVSPEMLVIWEAQFGDFANGAQVIIDQFIVGSQAKWGRTSGLVMLLPHGYEGQGPEHSNAYLERYLAACADDNIQVCNFTTPAQLFHALRRQQKRPFRRPLVVMSPKSLLRHPAAVSPVTELASGAFHELLDDPSPPAEIRRVVLCTGKVFYDLLARRSQLAASATALVRVEQLYPFPGRQLEELLGRYPNSAELVWAQEEPQNRGAFRFMQATLATELPHRPLVYVGRRASASPATGSARQHQREQQQLVTEAIGG
jgi:2-oxoglutarate dehydrogenase E1 component